MSSDEALPWLLGVARRTLANHRRGIRRADALADRLSATAARELLTDEPVVDDAVLRAFAELSDADRELLALTAWEGFSPGEAAEALAISGVSARVRLHRAKRRLAAGADVFPSPQMPIADFSPMRGRERTNDVYVWKLVGFAADGIAAVAVRTASGLTSRVPVTGNVYASDELPPIAQALVALDRDGNVVYTASR